MSEWPKHHPDWDAPDCECGQEDGICVCPHPRTCRCIDCEEDRADYLYHSRIDYDGPEEDA